MLETNEYYFLFSDVPLDLKKSVSEVFYYLLWEIS